MEVDREQHILNTAAKLIIHFGYDKTTMSDIAEQAGVTRAIVYLHFDSKERLFEALLHRETRKYLHTWLEALERETSGSAVGGVFRSALYAVNSSPLMAAMMKQDRHVFGKYLRRPGGIFQPVQSSAIWPEVLKQLQQVGAVRHDIQPEVMGHLMNALALGLLAAESSSPGEKISFDALLVAAADMMDRVFTPEDGGDQAAGRALILRLAQAVQYQFDQSQAG